jgi:hypothetical protein
MKEVAVVAARTLIALAAVVTVIVARPTVGWGHLAVMLAALGVLLVLLASYNRKFR